MYLTQWNNLREMVCLYFNLFDEKCQIVALYLSNLNLELFESFKYVIPFIFSFFTNSVHRFSKFLALKLHCCLFLCHNHDSTVEIAYVMWKMDW